MYNPRSVRQGLPLLRHRTSRARPRRLPGLFGSLLGPVPASLAGCAHEADVSAPRPRNLILIVADTLRADRLGCYGYPHELTPAIDSLAARGVMYRNNRSRAV